MIILVLLLVATLVCTVFLSRDSARLFYTYVLQNTGELELCSVRLQIKIVLFLILCML